MGLFDKLFGRRRKAVAPPSPPPPLAPPPAPPPTSSAAPTAPPSPKPDEATIAVQDSYGRKFLLTRQQWRDSILPGNLREAWNDPDRLYDFVVNALNDNFRAEVLPAAEHLFATDPNRARATNLWGVVLIDEGRLDEAERVLREYLSAHGEDSWILGNLAKVYAKRKDDPATDELLWRALTVDPNNGFALPWYIARQRERSGSAAATSELRRIARLPGSWRALLWLAREELDAGRLGDALPFYRQALERAERPPPAELLMQVSGDLGKHSHLRELLALVEPHFDPAAHGVAVGNNLIKAHVDRGEADAARGILDRLFALNRPDWREALNFWDTEIARARLADLPPPAPEEIEVTLLTIDGPVWLPAESPAAALFPSKPADELAVCFLGSSAVVPHASATPRVQLADHAGRMSRALPLFLAEQTFFATRARATTLIPWITRGGSGFVLSGAATDDAGAARSAQRAVPGADFVVAIHLHARADPWAAHVRLVRVRDAQCLATLEEAFAFADFHSSLPALAKRLLAALAAHAGVGPQPLPPHYVVPAGQDFASYLLRLEQLLAVRATGLEGTPETFLSGERAIVEGSIHLCASNPTNPTARLLLAQTVRAMRRVRPEVVREFQSKIALLQSEKPLDPEVQAAVEQVLAE